MQYCCDYALLILRVGIGIIYLVHGALKLYGGRAVWLWLGNQMSVVGVHVLPIFWGFLAMIAELGGGFFLLIGFKTRCAALIIMSVMTIAILMHIQQKSAWSVLAHPISLWFVMASLFISGGGKYSLDFILSRITC